MGENWLQEKIKCLESFMDNKSDYPIKMKERDKNLIKTLKEFSALPEKQQNKLKPLLEKTFQRHREIGRGLKILEYYASSFNISLNANPK